MVGASKPQHPADGRPRPRRSSKARAVRARAWTHVSRRMQDGHEAACKYAGGSGAASSVSREFVLSVARQPRVATRRVLRGGERGRLERDRPGTGMSFASCRHRCQSAGEAHLSSQLRTCVVVEASRWFDPVLPWFSCPGCVEFVVDAQRGCYGHHPPQIFSAPFGNVQEVSPHYEDAQKSS